MNEAMEMMENATEAVIDTTTEMTPIDCQSTEGGVAITVIKWAALGVLAIGAIALAKKDQIAEKIDAHQAKRLTRRGFNVSRPEVYAEDDIHEDCGVEVDAE